MLKTTLHKHGQNFTQLPDSSDRVVVAAPNHDTDVFDGAAAPRIFVTLDADVCDHHAEQVICSATVRFSKGRTAVVHFGVRVDGEKVTGKITAGGRTRETIKIVNVPVWARTHVKGKE